MSSRSEIVITNPGPQDDNASYSIRYADTVDMLIDGLEHAGVNHKTHPKVVDLFTGEGGVSTAFEKRGWSSKHITRIDKGLPVTPSQEKLLTWDLKALAYALTDGQKLPDEVAQYQNIFDLLVVFAPCGVNTFGFFGEEVLAPLGLFFLRRGGVAYLDMQRLSGDEMNKGWKYLHPARTDLYRKK